MEHIPFTVGQRLLFDREGGRRHKWSDPVNPGTVVAISKRNRIVVRWDDAHDYSKKNAHIPKRFTPSWVKRNLSYKPSELVAMVDVPRIQPYEWEKAW
jgi:hypothetical protein